MSKRLNAAAAFESERVRRHHGASRFEKLAHCKESLRGRAGAIDGDLFEDTFIESRDGHAVQL